MLGEAGFREISDDDASGGEPIALSATADHPPLQPTDRLFVPNRKRLSYSYVMNEEGVRELQIDYGLKEITFDEEHLFAFGEQLTRETEFTGEQATHWGPGYAWDDIAPLLEALLAEGVIARGDLSSLPRGGGLVPSALPPSVCPMHRMWSLAECEALTQELSGHPIEIGHVEAFAPVYRIAHPALDADDRQVGEGNVNPEELRLDRETEWRLCQYPGSRYRDPLPMNVTALKAMIKYWKPMMVTLVEIRGELGRRLGITGPWAIGDLHVLACVVLSLPAFQLLQRGGSSPQRPLHPVLSSLFRITDGIRMTTHDMMTIEQRLRSPGEPTTAAELYRHTEQAALFIGKTGVCAGPKPMVDEFLAIAVDGAALEDEREIALPDEVRGLLDQLPQAIDYALHGLQIWTLTVSSWLAMSTAYADVAQIFAQHLRIADPEADARFRARMEADRRLIAQQRIATVEGRGLLHAMHADTYARAARGLRDPIGDAQLAHRLVPVAAGAMHDAAATRLRALLGARFVRDAAADAAIARWAEIIVGYLREEQAILTAIAPLSKAIDRLLDRPRPNRPLGVWDLHFNNAMGNGVERAPYFVEMLDQELGIRADCTATLITIAERARSAP